MGEPITGAWARSRQGALPYVGARRWGTGINRVHYYRGDPGRARNLNLIANEMGGDATLAHLGTDDIIRDDWGYTPDDIAGLDVFTSTAVTGIEHLQDGYPDWQSDSFQSAGGENNPPTGGAPAPDGFNTGKTRGSVPSYAYHPWGMSGMAKNMLRSLRAGPRDTDSKVSNEIPTETVNEGWLNKPASGMGEGEIPDDMVLTSDPAQYERNTSMQQRHKTMNNERARLRGTDDDRTEIASRIAPMKLKVYSGQERHYDMFPYQMDDMPRPFWTRTFGTGPQSYMATNEQWLRNALQRTPPPDPSQGIPDTELSEDAQYGYAGEDQGYY